MEEENTTILYIQMGQKIDRDFIKLASRMGNLGITLVPVKPEELDYFITNKISNVVLLTRTIEQFQNFFKVKKRHIDFYLKSQKIRLIHLNSFSAIQEYIQLRQKQIYINLELPLTMVQVAAKLYEISASKENQTKKWPGGRRAKLPTDISRG